MNEAILSLLDNVLIHARLSSCYLWFAIGPAHKNPGERSSQYAAEASCRERYGASTEWMSFIDTDEYLVPMQRNEQGDYHWKPVLDEMGTKGISIMKFLSSRGLPRVDLME